MGEQAGKKTVNVLVEAQLLDEANRLHLDLAEMLERGLRSALSADRERRWEEDNKEAFAQYNARVAEHGLLSDDLGLL